MTDARQIRHYTKKRNQIPIIRIAISFVLALLTIVILINACGHTGTKFDQAKESLAKSQGLNTIKPMDEPKTTEPIEEPAVADDPVEQSAWVPSIYDVELIAKTLYGECRGVQSKTEKAAVAWCILNRVDTTGYACGHSVEYVVTFKNQFQGYDVRHPVTPELKMLAEDVLIRHHREQEGEADVGRILPKEYIYFIGDMKRNYFTTEFLGKDYWDWSLDSPYED